MESVLECPICTERFDRNKHLPLVLLCGHTLCKHCLGLIQTAEETIVCPMDKQIDSRNLNSISHSYHILDLIEQVSSMSQTIKYLKLSPSERLEAMKKQAQDNKEHLAAHLGAVRLKMSEINCEKLNLQTKISYNFEQMKLALDDREEVLLNEVHSISEKHLKEYQKIEETVNRQLEKASEMCESLDKIEDLSDEWPNVQPISSLPEIPNEDFKINFSCDVEKFIRVLTKQGKINQGWKVPFECAHFKNVTYWMVPPCCYKNYCCNKCHNLNETHPWAYANSMICMFCGEEQDYRKLPNKCQLCEANHTGVISK